VWFSPCCVCPSFPLPFPPPAAAVFCLAKAAPCAFCKLFFCLPPESKQRAAAQFLYTERARASTAAFIWRGFFCSFPAARPVFAYGGAFLPLYGDALAAHTGPVPPKTKADALPPLPPTPLCEYILGLSDCDCARAPRPHSPLSSSAGPRPSAPNQTLPHSVSSDVLTQAAALFFPHCAVCSKEPGGRAERSARSRQRNACEGCVCFRWCFVFGVCVPPQRCNDVLCFVCALWQVVFLSFVRVDNGALLSTRAPLTLTCVCIHSSRRPSLRSFCADARDFWCLFRPPLPPPNLPFPLPH
jgi:hypothetical protein